MIPYQWLFSTYKRVVEFKCYTTNGGKIRVLVAMTRKNRSPKQILWVSNLSDILFSREFVKTICKIISASVHTSHVVLLRSWYIAINLPANDLFFGETDYILLGSATSGFR